MVLNGGHHDSCAIVAIPARNEAARIERCLAALAVQRDQVGAPIADDGFEILIFANNCSDRTADIVRDYAPLIPQPVRLVEEVMPAERSNAGSARKRAMDLAAARSMDGFSADDVILTTDADSCVAPTWFAANMMEISAGADCVAGYVDACPPEILAIGRQFLARSRLEDRYLRLAAEIHARCDPRPHDPWPNHRVSSGASLAVRLSAYLAVGGLPPLPLGEDAALTALLDGMGFKVRHSMDVWVSTSCRLDGRAVGGAADTMRLRHDVPDAPCDDAIEPAVDLTRRAICKGLLRKIWNGSAELHELSARLGISQRALRDSLRRGSAFEEVWTEICVRGRQLKSRRTLRPSDLPREIEIAEKILRRVRQRFPSPMSRRTAPSDIRRSKECPESAFS